MTLYTETGDIAISNGAAAGGDMNLNGGTNVMVGSGGALISGGSMTITASQGHIDIGDATAETLELKATRGNIDADELRATATTENPDGSSNLELTAVEIGSDGQVALFVDSGTPIVAVSTINSTNLAANAASSGLLLQVYDADLVAGPGARDPETPATESFEIIDFSSATNIGLSTDRNSTVYYCSSLDDRSVADGCSVADADSVTHGGEVLAIEESVYILPNPPIRLPLDQNEEDEFSEDED